MGTDVYSVNHLENINLDFPDEYDARRGVWFLGHILFQVVL